MTEHKLYTGQEILDLPLDFRKPIIDSLIWEDEIIILVGKAGISKSIFVQQMMFSISCGEPFLSQYKSSTNSIVYVQAEGTLPETKKRVRNMLEAVSWDSKRFNLLFYPNVILNRDFGIKNFMKLIDDKIGEGMENPKLIVLDPLYMCMHGDMTKQEEASRMCKGLSIIREKYNCAILIVHHEHRPKMDEKGGWRQEGSESLYGSMVWQAFADTIFGVVGTAGGHRRLLCYKQRSGEVIEQIDLSFIQPVPLLFEIKGDVAPFIKTVQMNLKKNFAITPYELVSITGLSYNSIKRAITYLRKAELITKEGEGYPVRWRLK